MDGNVAFPPVVSDEGRVAIATSRKISIRSLTPGEVRAHILIHLESTRM